MRAQVRKIKRPIGMKDEGLAEMFNQMLGAGSVNMTIAYPRYTRMRDLLRQLIRLFDMFAKSVFMRAYTVFEQQRLELEAFCARSRDEIDKLFSVDLTEYEWNLNLVEEELRKHFTTVYETMKKSDTVNTFIIVCDRLVKYKRNFSDLSKLNHKFITTMPGAEWSPFPFTTLNLVDALAVAQDQPTIRFIMTFLAKVFELSYKLYEETQTPDIDVDQFVDVIMANIGEIQKQPELHRCRKAFQKIKESVELLKTRFNGYYRDFIVTKDSTIMMQHFILDVSKNTNADPQITREFRCIISYYRKVAQSQISNPQVKKLFDRVNESFKDLERGTENLVNIKEDSDEEPEDTV